ncbi:uncharacterized protein LOC132264538 [Phlebotomus argentipes]|uniref:uncharacterized protein LOC132264538 n=1 Tax=Phlebotomus argentipes TaxID=94469 RepID=UPI002892BA4A|nr:uncharacterized protein LOC132264538 [Phlebotomus argentipes]
MSEGVAEVEAKPPTVVNGQKKMNDLFDTNIAPPDWLNQDLLQKALRNYESDNTLLVTECNIVPATKPGDNFASVVYRAHLAFTSKKNSSPEKLSVIIKVKPFVDGLKKEMMGEVPFFETEIEMYTKVLPEMQRLLTQTGDSDIIAPNIIYHGLNPDFVIFEDIAKYGYVAKHDALNYDSTVQVITKLAKLHALSYYIQNESILDLTTFDKGLITDGIGEKMEFIPQSFNTFIEGVKSYGKYDVIVEKLKAVQPFFFDKLGAVYKANPNNFGFNVLNHGDFHIRNLMFRFNDEGIEHVSFIDFQICFWGTPAVDLYYILYAMASSKARERQEELLRIYHDKFCSLLTDLGYLKKPPSLLDLHIELLRHGFMEVFLASCFLPIFYMDLTKFAAELESQENGSEEKGFEFMLEFQMKIYREEGELKNVIETLLPKLLHTGQLEI